MWDYAIQSTQIRTIIIRKEFVNREKYQFAEYNYTNHPLYKVIQTGRRMENQSESHKTINMVYFPEYFQSVSV